MCEESKQKHLIDYSKISKVFYLNSMIAQKCPDCDFHFNHEDSYYNIGDHINHMMSEGWILLHVGQETTHDSEGKPWHNTVAIMGKKK